MDLAKIQNIIKVRSGNSSRSRYIFLSGLIILLSIFFSIANPNFLSIVNIGILLRSISVLFLISMGMSFVLISGGIDLSVGSSVAFSGGVGVVILTTTGNPFLATLGALAAGALIGFINGYFVGKLDLSPFMITLATMALARGLALVMYKADAIAVNNELFLWLGKTSIGAFPIVIVFDVLVFFVLFYLLNRNIFGRDVYSIGCNKDTAFLLGRNVTGITVKVYMLSGLLAGISSIITVGRVSSGQPWAGLGLEFDAITAVIIGGTSLDGGEGSLVGTIFGVIFYGIIINGLILTGANPYLQSIAKGLILLIVVCLDRLGGELKTNVR